ncbi:putative alpha-galactosidase [Helianthus annuus]|nr:putative alpha-galactosidase [Helianthus annuus]
MSIYNLPANNMLPEEDPDSVDEDRFEHVLGGQLKINDGVYRIKGGVRLKVRDSVLFQIGDLEKNQIPMKLLRTKLSLVHMTSWAAQTNKWAKHGGRNDPDMWKIGNRGYHYPHRVGVGPLAHNKVTAYWFDIGLNSTIAVKARDFWKHSTRRLVEGQISATIEWLIAWYNNFPSFRLEDKSFHRPGCIDTILVNPQN